jgi:hypothetical protein
MAITAPTDITGCVLWLDAYELDTLYQDSAGTTPVTTVGDPVGRVEDLSGNGNHATQATSGDRPEYVGGGAIEHDGVDTYLSIADSATYKVTQPHIFFYGQRDSGAADVFQVLVAYPHNTTHSSPFFRWSLQYQPTNQLQFAWDGLFARGNYSGWSDDYHAYELETSTAFVDGTEIGTRSNRNITYPNATGIRIGANADNGEIWHGTWKRIVIYDHTLTSGERADVLAWLATEPSAGDVTVSAALGTLTLTPLSASVVVSGVVSVSAALGTLSITGQSAAVSPSGSASIAAALTILSLTPLPATVVVSGTANVSAALGQLAIAGLPASVAAGGTVVQAALGTLALTPLPASVVASGSVSITVPVGLLILVGLSAVVAVGTLITPASRTYIIDAEMRVFIIDTDSRVFAIAAEDRTYRVEG